MREMVLNHASIVSSDGRTAVDWLKDVATGMAQIVAKGVAESSLRMCRSVSEIYCLPGCSLFDAYLELLKDGDRDKGRFLMRLSEKHPLLSDIELDFRDRFLACEAKDLSPEDGEPLVLCAITDWIAVGFPSAPGWDCDCLTVSFNELLPDDCIEGTSETIDNLTRSVHALSICERRHAILLRCQSPSALWERREEAFLNLIFGPDVKIDPKFFGPTVKKLIALDESAAQWRKVGGNVPPWTCTVTPETVNLMNNPKLREARRFKSQGGTRELFEWHAKFSNGRRIHLRFNADSRKIEIGYIGPHLPL